MFWKENLHNQVQDKGMTDVTLNVFQWLFLRHAASLSGLLLLQVCSLLNLCWERTEKWEMLAWFECLVLVLFCFCMHSCLTDSHSKSLSSFYKNSVLYKFTNLQCLISLSELTVLTELSWNCHSTIFSYKDFRILCLSQPIMQWKQSFSFFCLMLFWHL